jgi:DNA-binding transcriptional ArsR family regulator
MSEYQYYEFLALDRPLTTNEKAYIETLSSRVELSSTQAIFVYNYGDFRGNPKEVLEKCFDIMLYMANWGSRRLMFRLPKSLIDVVVLQVYSLEDKIIVSETKNFVILDINIIDEEISGWIDSGEEYLSEMIPLRDDLLRGDYRCLYLAWLKAAPMCGDYEDEEDYIEPPVPANLNDLSETLSAFIDFFEIDRDLIAGAATASKYQEEESESLEDLIPSLSDEERNDFLARLLKGESQLSGQLAHRLRELSGKKEINFDTDTPRRALSELLKLAEGETDQRQKQEQEIAHHAKVQKLEALAKKKEKVWNQVFDLIALKQSKPYEQAVALLVDLRDLAEYQGKLEEFQLAIKQMKKDYSNRPGLISRLQKAGLL